MRSLGLGGLRPYMKKTLRFGEWESRYWVEGAMGAVEFWFRKNANDDYSDIEKVYGGIEQHSVTTDDDRPPSHGQCEQCSGRPCWHDGSSLYAQESWIPSLSDTETEDSRASWIFRRLAGEYRRRFNSTEEQPR